MNISHSPFRGFVVNPTHEYLFFSYQRAIFIVTCPINLLTFYLIQTKTPGRSTTFKKLMLHLHFWVSIYDVFNAILFLPVPLFPIVAGYCEGILCNIGLPMHYGLSLMHMLFTNITYSLFIGYIYRHQALLQSGHFLKLGKRRAIIFGCFLWLFYQTAFICRFFNVDESYAKVHLEATYPDMMWLMDKQDWCYYNMEDPNSSERVIAKFVGFKNSVFSPWLIFAMVMHIFHILRGYIPTMSASTKRYHRHLTIVLIVQSSCLIFIFIPIAGSVFSIITQRWSYEVTFIFFGLLLLFSVAHSICLIAMTPSYRGWIMSVLRLTPNSITVSVVSSSDYTTSSKASFNLIIG
ncbi:hypothetical protein PENTCL1PPCAC_17170 [Pristionchus entomophagus]|uniref:G protein-coupled receptor n=1 Tax=Pristionchus entomophagus TaxID=358040 RepID=A0AAV5TL25_9BILA|nr:hypothetical protein PENTCL1PPCAC_17170 [Pristionchus entomophagus]